MSMVWKLLIALGLLLPSGAFVAGMLVASTAEPQVPRETILIRDFEPGPDSSTRSPNRQPERSSTPSPSLSPTGDGVADPHADNGDDGRVEVITPDPDDLDDDGDNRGRDGDLGDDDGDNDGDNQGDDDGDRDDDADGDDDGDHDDTGGPGPDDGDDADDDNSGPGGGDDADDSDDNSGPGGGDDADDGDAPDDDSSGPGGGDDPDDDNSGHGSGDDPTEPTTKWTTDPTTDRPDARPPRSGVSVRVRITATVALLVTLALAGAGLIVYAIESDRVEEQTLGEIDQELSELERLQENGLNPDTREPFESVEAMLMLFLARNVPNDDELLVGWWRGRPQVSSPADDLAESPTFQAAVAAAGPRLRLDPAARPGGRRAADHRAVRAPVPGDGGAGRRYPP